MLNRIFGRDIKILILVFILTRIILLLTGLNVRQTFKVDRPFDLHDETEFYGKVGTVLHGWDSHWYMEIAQNGYKETDSDSATESHLVFFPLFPMLIKLFGILSGNFVVAAAILTNVFYFLAGVFLYKLILLKNKNIALFTAIYLFVFPVNFIFSAIQSESLFLMLLLMAFYFLESKRFFLAAIIGFFLSLTKHVGFLIFIPVIYYCYKNIGILKPFAKLKIFIFGSIPLLGFLLFNFYLYQLTGDALAILHLEKGWSKAVTLNLFKPLMLFTSEVNPFLVQLNFLIGFLIVAIAGVGAKILGPAYLYIVISYFLVYLSTTSLFWHTFSFGRYFAVLFPAYFYLANISAELKRTKYFIPLVLMLLQLLLFHLWTRGWPIPM